MHCLVCNSLMVDGTSYARCPNPQCGLVKVLAPVKYNLDDYTQTYKSWHDSDLEVRINVNRVATVMKFVPTGKRVLDYGCSCGNFLQRLEHYGYACEGYEPSKSAPENKTCTAPIHTDVDHIKGKFDCITMFDVFEHIENPAQITAYLRSLLVSHGHLVIITPNPGYQEDLENFYHLKPGEHAYLWSRNALMQFMADAGFIYKHDEFSEGWIRQNARNKYGATIDSLLTMVFVRDE